VTLLARVITVAAAICWLLTTAAAAQSPEWWRREDVQRQLRLTPPQIQAIDALFDGTLQRRRALRAALDREARALEEAIARDDEQTALERIPRVEAARTARNKERTLLLLRIYRVLTPAQRSILKRIRARR
jgi:Spy/CpxP family protein refolding chaperone